MTGSMLFKAFGMVVALWMVPAVSGLTATVSAQSLIVGVPNGRVTPAGMTLLAHESQLNTWSGDPSWTSFYFATRGVGDFGIGLNTELCATVFNISSPASFNRTLALGFKTSVPLKTVLPETDLSVSFGQMIPFSFDGKGVGTWSYANVSLRLPVVNMRLTGGPSYGTRQIFGRDAFSMMLGYELPVAGGFSLVGDWYSGTHDIAAYIAAVQYDVTKHFIVIAGYKIPNNAVSGPHSALIEITYEF